MKPTLFISDLHLDPDAPATLELFTRFCREQARHAQALYILGDLFEAWVGDDADDAAAAVARTALSTLQQQQVPVHLLPGNRDFLLGQRFAAACGARLHPDPTTLDVHGRRVVLSHGDSLCSEDADYMALRETLRSRAFAADMLARPLAERRALADEARRHSRSANANKADNIMDVTAAAVDDLLDREDADLLIHGHTHRPAVHRWRHGGRERTRIVLGAWDGSTRYAEAVGTTLHLRQWP